MIKKIFSLAYLTIPGTHPVDQIEIAARCGYEGVGLRTISQQLPGEPDFRMSSDVMFQNVKAALNRTGVRLMDIELARVGDGIDVMSYETEFERAAALGARYAIASVWSANREFSLEQLGKLCDMAARYDMMINLEYMAFSNIRTLEETAEVIDLLNRPNLKLLVDHLHSHRAGVTQALLETLPPDRLGFVHLCDGPAWIPPTEHPDMAGVARTGRLYVGEGGIDLLGMLRGTPNAPYYSIELPSVAETAVRGKLGHARRCLETAKKFFTANAL